jgi:hypothetical protein
MTISYNENIPATGNRPSADQPVMRTNAAALKQIIGIDHITFGDSTANNGYHNVIHFKTQSADPVMIANIGQLYTKTVSGDEYPFFETGLGTVFQLAGNASSIAATGYTTLPNGLIFQWGTKTTPGLFGFVDFPIPFPSGNPPFSLQLTLERDSVRGLVVLNDPPSFPAPTASRFYYLTETSGSDALYWFAIGN